MKAISCLILMMAPLMAVAVEHSVAGPDGRLVLTVNDAGGNGAPTYSITYDGKVMLCPSPLGFNSSLGDFTRDLIMKSHSEAPAVVDYSIPHIKKSHVTGGYNRLVTGWTDASGRQIEIEFMVGDNDVAFRYVIPRHGECGAVRILNESTGFRLPEGTTTFLSPQSDAMIGWKRTKPSYEEKYRADAPMDTVSQYGHGYTFPALFHTPGDGWVLVSETGVDSHYCGSRLSDFSNGLYTVEFPMPEENNGNGTSEPAFALPGATPWRTVTVGSTLAPVVETTVTWDMVAPVYSTDKAYKPGRGTWSWILWQDNSINYDDQVKFIDLAAAMGYEYTLIDNWWDTRIGREGIEKLARYAASKGVSLIMWYSSSGYWNDIEQSPVNHMDNSIVRKQEMRWLRDIGVKGIKVDFFGGDKQETMRLYEEILSDADDNGLMVIFHGCTLPRGWERMFPNYVGSEAVLASENMVFSQQSCDEEAFNAALHPFIRNTVGCMEFGGSFLNKRLNRGNDGGSRRVTSDVFQLATAVLFQNPVQNFALAPNNLTDAPAVSLDFMRAVPTVWDEIRFIDGYPGRYVVLARRSGATWYVAGINSTGERLRLKTDLSFLAGKKGDVYLDGKEGVPVRKSVEIPRNGAVELDLAPAGGVVYVVDN
ncbi:MAG: glycoside hydrolase family 97 protein [Paenibacillus sp.]|nr:glycoside hydrolase family 97 protein [Paenibacillus sp.]